MAETRVLGFDEVAWLRDNSPAWRPLRAENAPLVLSFLHQVFVAENVRSIPAAELVNRLDDELYALNQRDGQAKKFPRPARAYLDDWAAPETGWLRKYYPEGTDEPHVDATPAVEKALSWVGALKEREFVGTESRLNTVIDLLRQIVFGTETDPEQRIAELLRQRHDIDEQIARIRDGRLDLLDASAVRDRYQQFSATARELLADVLGSRETIAGSDQGRSFQAFYDFLLSRARQEELSDLLDSVHNLHDLPGKDTRLRHIHYDWLDAAERTQATVRQLSEQLRRFLDDQVWFERRDGRELPPAHAVAGTPPDAAGQAGRPVGRAAGHRAVDRRAAVARDVPAADRRSRRGHQIHRAAPRRARRTARPAARPGSATRWTCSNRSAGSPTWTWSTGATSTPTVS